MLKETSPRRFAAFTVFLGLALSGCGLYASSGSSASFYPVSQKVVGQPGRLKIKSLSSSQDLLYVVNEVDQSVHVYSYPQGQSVGVLAGLVYPAGECVDAAGDIFIVSAQSTTSGSGSIITEYAHGGVTPIATLNEPSGATGCAVDQGSGDLAVCGGYLSDGSPYGDVAVFSGAQGNPKMYYSSTFAPFLMCGYDSKGDLYISAESSTRANEYQLVRLRTTQNKFEEISLATTLVGSGDFPPSVQWDGAHITVSSASASRSNEKTVYIYRLSVSGQKATVVGTTDLKAAHPARSGQIWIDGSQVVGSDFASLHGGIAWWAYPKARKHHTVVPNTPNMYPFGIVVSNASE